MTGVLDAPRLACPGPRGDTRDGVGNGRGHWDWFYALPIHEQRSLRYFMSPEGMEPDRWAQRMGYADTEEAMHFWRILVSEHRHADEWESYEEPEPDPEYVGPGEVAELLGVKRATIRQWRKRRQLPPPAMLFRNGSGEGFPVWRADDILAWAALR